ncbi:MAG: hypothetical protein KC464_35340 [Myxococcales bacterium]|nr:hypothetical protein [Myxococcales bacterium]MCB9508262.1 hypothetical protein [Myxococcales bacterium]MCB9521435.1 hypothetical protein [Myxococcales bacterium]
MSMTPRQCEIAAEAYTTSLLAQCGYDVLVQYGANQPEYDLVADRSNRMMRISVKGSQDGGWMLAVGHKAAGVSYHDAIDLWRAKHRAETVFFFVQFLGVAIGELPRVYVAQPDEIAAQLKSQRAGVGYGALIEERRRRSPKSKYDERIPAAWEFSQSRIDAIAALR